ncbi:TRAP transporter substrate-binding protein [Rhizobium halophilum]|uniref:TRAP transporter substrate-binding protein n=1 Tax=Rhizobium halophilum TaxID=2846852 RepID=UPI001EFC5CAB|nr:TRAP transporter substrate-binding protein [Rhizobium halophilum]MCF6369094.1 TRAP transporter substrate-binding protein [Rhizobium halophilum]
MVSITRRALVSAAALAPVLAAPVFLRSASARTTALAVASLLGDDKPETKVWRRIEARLEERLPGRFRFRIVTNGALGGEKDVADGARLGSIQASLSTVSTLSAWVPELQLLDLPFLFRDADHLRRVVSGPIGDGLKQRLAENGFVVPDFIDYGARHLLAKEAVTRPDQLQGKTMRVIQSPLHTKLWSAFGAVPVGIPITETYNALATGVADAMDLTASAYAGFKLFEVVPYLTKTAHIRSSGVIFFAESFWNSLTEDERAIVTEVSAEAALYFNALMEQDEAESLELAQANGETVLLPEALSAWQEGARTVWTAFEEIVGGPQVIETVRTTA